MSVYSSSESAVQMSPGGVAVLLITSESGLALLELVDLLVQAGISAILVVDDGSSGGTQWVLDRIGLEPRVHLLRHTEPQGEGAALKTGITYFLEHLRHYKGLVTAAGDGQYTAEDVLRVARGFAVSPKLVVLGARESRARRAWFDSEPRGRAPRQWMLRTLFRLFTGLDLMDVQSRLRALPTALLPRLVRIPGVGREYELAMLLHIAQSGQPVAEHAVAGPEKETKLDSRFVGGSFHFLRALVNYARVEEGPLPQRNKSATRSTNDGEHRPVREAPTRQIH
jgi:glycosyltransferase involved in cell wall biosynthesis